MSRRGWCVLLGLATVVVSLGPGLGQPPAAPAEHLPGIGPAPEFTLTTQAGKRLSLSDFRGKVLGHTVVSSAVDRPWSQYFC